MLRTVTPDDIGAFFEHQTNAEAARMVGFASRSRADHDAHRARILRDPALMAWTIVEDGQVVGEQAVPGLATGVSP